MNLCMNWIVSDDSLHTSHISTQLMFSYARMVELTLCVFVCVVWTDNRRAVIIEFVHAMYMIRIQQFWTAQPNQTMAHHIERTQHTPYVHHFILIYRNEVIFEIGISSAFASRKRFFVKNKIAQNASVRWVCTVHWFILFRFNRPIGWLSGRYRSTWNPFGQ